jgi:inward rectifier potassium channel
MPNATPRKVVHFRGEHVPSIRVRTRGHGLTLGGDVYFAMMTWPFWRFCLAVGLIVLVVNTIFAAVYMIEPGCVTNAHTFEDSFFFSVQTLATIGYGTMAPQTRFAHIVVTVESILGVIAVGSMAGVAFARLSRPRSRVLFSEKMVVRPHNGVPHLQFRIANWRTNFVIEASVRVFVLTFERTAEGETTRTPVDLKLVRAENPVFFLSWMVMHPIDESSPLFGDGLERLKADRANLYVMMSGWDHNMGQMVHAYWEYKLADVVQNARFVEVVTVTDDGVREIDFGRFHDIEPLE